MRWVWKHSKARPTDRFVLLAIADVASDEGEASAYQRSQKAIVKKTGLSERTVRDAIARLEAAGELEVVRQGNGRASTDYRMTMIEGGEDCPPARQPVPPTPAAVAPQGGEDCPPIIPSLSVDSPSLSSPTFEDFYAAYPRKQKPLAARASWEKATKRASPERILAGAVRFAADPNRMPEYTPHPSSWLNAGSWDDEPLPPRRANGHAPPLRQSVGDANLARLRQRQAERERAERQREQSNGRLALDPQEVGRAT